MIVLFGSNRFKSRRQLMNQARSYRSHVEMGLHSSVGLATNEVARMAKVSKSYGNVPALQAFSLSIRRGELLSLLGPNGAGKTTAIKLLLGIVRPDTGSVSIFGSDPSLAATRTRIGAMLQVAKVPETLKVREHIDLFSSYYPRPLALHQTLAIAGLEDIQNRRFGDLSGGQKQRVLFALALCGDPDLIFLDEPTVGLDVEARRGLWQEIRKLVARGKTVLLTTHYLEEADALADRVVVIHRGAVIAEGTPAEIKARTAGRKIRCITSLSLDMLRAMPGVLQVGQDREAMELRVAEAEPVLRELLSRDADIRGMEVSSAGLEEAFLALTNGSTTQNSAERR
jgi:ABC-2 type transport system ATP-binding protein